MSREYKFHNPEGLYFVSFATLNWVDLFVRETYFTIMVESLKYCIENEGLLLYSWCIMPSHVHLIFSLQNDEPGKILGNLKSYTSEALLKELSEGYSESRKEWITWMFKQAGVNNGTTENIQVWQPESHPIELRNKNLIDQKIEYIHMNPVIAGFVTEPHYWKYSSATDNNNVEGLLKLGNN